MSALPLRYSFHVDADASQFVAPVESRARGGLRPRSESMDRMTKSIHSSKRFSFEAACAAIEAAALKAKNRAR